MGRSFKRTRAVAFLLTSMILLAFCQPVAADFTYVDFTTTNGLYFNGDAVPVGDVIRLTPSDSAMKGAALYESKQRVDVGFQTQFDFRISERSPWDGQDGGDGFAFVIQNSSLNALGRHGVGIGYGGYDDEGIANSIAVEFDTYKNGLADMTAPHISVQTRGTLPNMHMHDYSLGSTSEIGSIENGAVHTAQINYVPGYLSILLDDSRLPTLAVPVDLSSLLDLDGGKAWVGFTAGTGAAYETHDILSWEFTEVPEPTTLLLLGLGAVMVRRRQ